MKKDIRITLIDKKGDCECKRGHRIGDSFSYQNDLGKLCPMALHSGFPYIDILRYGGQPPKSKNGDIRFCCPDCDVINIFRIEEEK